MQQRDDAGLQPFRRDAVTAMDIPADLAATLVNPQAYADHRLHDAYRWLRVKNPLGI
jgi:hypothetical protein